MTEVKKENKDVGKVPNLRFPEFEGEWETIMLRTLLEFKNGINASKEQYGKGVKFINVLDILSHDYITHEKISGQVDVDSDTANKYSVEYGDILFQRSSESREEVGTANVYLDQEQIATFGGFVIRGRKIGKYDPLFLNKLLKTKAARDQITSKSGGSTRYNVGQEILSSVSLKFPIIEEQEKISSFLRLIDKRIETQNKIIKELNILKSVTTKKIFSQELRFKDNNGKEFPDWEEKKLKDISIKKSSNLSANTLYKNQGEFKIYGATGLLKKVDFYTEEESYIAIVKDGAGVGRLLLCDQKSSVLGTLDIIKNKEQSNLYFLYYMLNTIEFSKFTTGSTIPHIYFKDYSNELIGFPSLPEQTKIADFLSAIDSKVEVQKQFLIKLERQRRFFLQQMFV